MRLVLRIIYQKQLQLLVNLFGLIIAFACKPRLRRMVIIISISHAIICMYIQGMLQDWIQSHEDSLLILDAHKLETESHSVIEELRQSYLPANYHMLVNESTYSYSSGSMYDHLNGEYDPRLLPALWLAYISNNLNMEENDLSSRMTIPFDWNTLLNLKSRFKTSHYVDINKIDCETVKDLYRLDEFDVYDICQSLDKAPNGYFRFRINRPMDRPTSEEVRKIFGASYLLYSAPIPNRVCLLGIGPDDGGLIVPTSKIPSDGCDSDNVLSYLMKDHLDFISKSRSITNEETISIHNETHRIRNLLEDIDSSISYMPDESIIQDVLRPLRYEVSNVLLSKADFMFDLNEYKHELQEKVTFAYEHSLINEFDTKMLKCIHYAKRKQEFEKYFHEASIIGRGGGSHYDWRFFKTMNYSNYERQAILHRLTRAWLRFSNTIGIKTWLAHGSMLGWYWNGMNLPWDQDLDVQITMGSLLKLARNYNQTLVVDLTDHGSSLNHGTGSYLVDVGPSYFSREKGNGKNTIDARFIDTDTGFYVDITALAFSSSANQIAIRNKQFTEFNQVLDPDFMTKENSQTILKEELYSDLFSKKRALYNSKNIFNCRNNHFYTLEDLDPLIPTIFEGTITHVPSNFKQILRREYSRGILYYQYASHIFRPVLDLWVPSKICKKDFIGNNCLHKETLLQAEYYRPLTSMHRTEMMNPGSTKYTKKNELGTLRLDPWIIKRGQRISHILSS